MLAQGISTGWQVKILAAIPLLYGVAVLARYEAYFSLQLAIYAVLLPSLSLGVILLGRALAPETATVLAKFALAAVLALYVAEAVLDWGLIGPALGLKRYATTFQSAMDGSPYDDRLKSEVVADLKARFPRQAVVPQLSPETIIDHGYPRGLQMSDGDYVLPLAGPSHSLVVTCNEMGYWGSFQSDRFGFNNPDHLWDENPSIAVLGSSHTQGLCLRPGDGWVDVLRGQYPDVINLGQSNSGALYQFAITREYISAIKPRLVVWVFCDCFDAGALSIELQNATLRRYLDDAAFSQRLKSRQSTIDLAENRFIDDVSSSTLLRYKLAHEEANLYLWNWPTLQTIRSSLKSLLGIKNEAKIVEVPIDESSGYPEYQQIMAKARDYVASWGGRIHVVFLSDVKYQTERTPSPYRGKIHHVVEVLGLTITDTYDVFDKLPDPASLHPFRTRGHLIPEGARLMSDAISEDIRPLLPQRPM